jgi:MFS family permease
VAGGSGSAIAVVAAIVFGVNVVHDAMYGPQAAWFAELFDTRVRYSGSSLGYQIGAVLSGGFAPLIAAALLAVGGGRPWLIVAYFAVLAGITVAAAYRSPRPWPKQPRSGRSPGTARRRSPPHPVRLPFLCEPSPQRTPVLFQAGASPRGVRFAAAHAEADVDGFNLAYVTTPGTFVDFAKFVVPELRRRGRVPDHPDHDAPLTLRERLGGAEPLLSADHPGAAYRNRLGRNR